MGQGQNLGLTENRTRPTSGGVILQAPPHLLLRKNNHARPPPILPCGILGLAPFRQQSAHWRALAALSTRPVRTAGPRSSPAGPALLDYFLRRCWWRRARRPWRTYSFNPQLEASAEVLIRFRLSVCDGVGL